MSKPYTGGCACGAIRYEIADEPLFQFNCQCRDCQRMSGTGHGCYLAFPSKLNAICRLFQLNVIHVAETRCHLAMHEFENA